jgi:hypothetical protein
MGIPQVEPALSVGSEYPATGDLQGISCPHSNDFVLALKTSPFKPEGVQLPRPR